MNKILINTLVLISFLGTILLSVLWFRSNEKIAYIDIIAVHDDFVFKKEMEAKLSSSQNARQKLLDSLNMKLKLLGQSIKSKKEKKAIDEYGLYVEELRFREQQLNRDASIEAGQYKEQIWKRLRQYIAEFAKQNHYDIIYGVDESYSFIYTNPSFNITEEVKVYVNNQYSGIDK